MYNYGDKVICIIPDRYSYLIKGDIYKVVGLNTNDEYIQLVVAGLPLLWVRYNDVIPLNDATKLLYTTKDSMDWT